jgi:hypothetical protein
MLIVLYLHTIEKKLEKKKMSINKKKCSVVASHNGILLVSNEKEETTGTQNNMNFLPL